MRVSAEERYLYMRYTGICAEHFSISAFINSCHILIRTLSGMLQQFLCSVWSLLNFTFEFQQALILLRLYTKGER
jgi:hypothetical protein